MYMNNLNFYNYIKIKYISTVSTEIIDINNFILFVSYYNDKLLLYKKYKLFGI